MPCSDVGGATGGGGWRGSAQTTWSPAPGTAAVAGEAQRIWPPCPQGTGAWPTTSHLHPSPRPSTQLSGCAVDPHSGGQSRETEAKQPRASEHEHPTGTEVRRGLGPSTAHCWPTRGQRKSRWSWSGTVLLLTQTTAPSQASGSELESHPWVHPPPSHRRRPLASHKGQRLRGSQCTRSAVWHGSGDGAGSSLSLSETADCLPESASQRQDTCPRSPRETEALVARALGAGAPRTRDLPGLLGSSTR